MRTITDMKTMLLLAAALTCTGQTALAQDYDEEYKFAEWAAEEGASFTSEPDTESQFVARSGSTLCPETAEFAGHSLGGRIAFNNNGQVSTSCDGASLKVYCQSKNYTAMAIRNLAEGDEVTVDWTLSDYGKYDDEIQVNSGNVKFTKADGTEVVLTKTAQDGDKEGDNGLDADNTSGVSGSVRTVFTMTKGGSLDFFLAASDRSLKIYYIGIKKAAPKASGDDESYSFAAWACEENASFTSQLSDEEVSESMGDANSSMKLETASFAGHDLGSRVAFNATTVTPTLDLYNSLLLTATVKNQVLMSVMSLRAGDVVTIDWTATQDTQVTSGNVKYTKADGTEVVLTVKGKNDANQLPASDNTDGYLGSTRTVFTMTADGSIDFYKPNSKNSTLSIYYIGIKHSLTIDDSEKQDFVPAYSSYADVTYNRSIEGGKYGTVCLPFTPDEASCEAYSFYELNDWSADAVTFVKVDAPVAGKPYIYCLTDKEATEAPAITGAAQPVPAEAGVTEIGGWQMVGSFANATVECAGENIYAFNGEKQTLNRVTRTLKVLPYRAYIKSLSQAIDLKSLTVRISGPTGIEQISAADVEGLLPVGIYDLMGRPIQNPQRGSLYIVNGEKRVY